MVERNLAKVEVESSRLFSRSNSEKGKRLLPFFIPLPRLGKLKSRRGSKAVMPRIANPVSPVRLRTAPPDLSGRNALSASVGGAFLFDNRHPCLSGEIGRHIGLKIRRFVNNGRTGSIPVSGTIQYF